jgi:hypothetical protein
LLVITTHCHGLRPLLLPSLQRPPPSATRGTGRLEHCGCLCVHLHGTVGASPDGCNLPEFESRPWRQRPCIRIVYIYCLLYSRHATTATAAAVTVTTATTATHSQYWYQCHYWEWQQVGPLVSICTHQRDLFAVYPMVYRVHYSVSCTVHLAVVGTHSHPSPPLSLDMATKLERENVPVCTSGWHF